MIATVQQITRLEGLQLGSIYQLNKEISRGPTASIYRGVDVRNDQPVAIKVFHERYLLDPRFAIRFREHLRRLAEISHENLLAIHDYGLDQGHYYVAMAWVEGVDLGTYIAEHGPSTPALSVYIARQVCAALGVVHEHGLIHRGVKPQKILLQPDGRVKVTDVGMSGLLSETGLSKTNVMLGGVGYISPEQARAKQLTPQSDIYSLGVTLFEALTGRLPFVSNEAWSLVRMHAREAPPSPKQFNPQVPEALADVIIRTLQKDPERRFSSATELDAALSSLQDNITVDWIGVGSMPRKSAGIGLMPALKDIFEPQTLKTLLRRPSGGYVLGRNVPAWVVLTIVFLLAFILTLMIVNLLVTLLG